MSEGFNIFEVDVSLHPEFDGLIVRIWTKIDQISYVASRFVAYHRFDGFKESFNREAKQIIDHIENELWKSIPIEDHIKPLAPLVSL